MCPDAPAPPTAAARIEAAEKRRADRRAAAAGAREAQHATDLEALEALEVEHADSSLARLDLDRHVAGQPTFVILKTPGSAQYKRFVDQVSRAAEKSNMAGRREAQDLLARSCWVYPAEAAQAAMLEHFPGLLVSIALRASQLVEGKAEAEGKG